MRLPKASSDRSRIAFALVALVAAACSGRPRTAGRELPAPPVLGAPIDRIGRPLTGNALIGLFDSEDASNLRKEQYNRAAQADWQQFAGDLERSLALYDGFDGRCGNQWLAAPAPGPARYHALAALFADDRLWLDTRAHQCTSLLAVERAALGGPAAAPDDCGGRTLEVDAVDAFRSLLAIGELTGLEDGIAHDDRASSSTDFPFLAAP